eukprot:403347056
MGTRRNKNQQDDKPKIWLDNMGAGENVSPLEVHTYWHEKLKLEDKYKKHHHEQNAFKHRDIYNSYKPSSAATDDYTLARRLRITSNGPSTKTNVNQSSQLTSTNELYNTTQQPIMRHTRFASDLAQLLVTPTNQTAVKLQDLLSYKHKYRHQSQNRDQNNTYNFNQTEKQLAIMQNQK